MTRRLSNVYFKSPLNGYLEEHQTLISSFVQGLRKLKSVITTSVTFILLLVLRSQIMMVVGSYTILWFFIFLCVFCPFTACSGISTANVTIKVVDQTGKGDYWRIQEAIDAVPSGNPQHVLILVKPGVYREKIVVPSNKPFITLSGTKPGTTTLSWDDHRDIFESPTLTVLGSDFIGRFLTIQNVHGPGAKAVALRVSADRVAFGCRILSHQDTLLDDTGRHYYENCYIEGDTDFICGNGASVFKRCHLHSVSEAAGAITAQHRVSDEEETGFLFVGCNISGTKGAILGRPWGAYSRVVFAQTYMSSVILPRGWDDWGDSSKQRTVYYGEYRSYGAGATSSGRVQWSHNLTAQEAAPYLSLSIIGGRSWIRSVSARYKKIFVSISNHTDDARNP